MKKIFLIAFVCLGLAAVASPAHSATTKAHVCQIVALEGSVTIVMPAGTSKSAAVGTYLYEGDTVKTGPKSLIVISYDLQGKNLMHLAENSEITIRAIRPTDIFLKNGAIMARLNKLSKGETFEISTPVCVAAVRGTFYGVSHGTQGTNVYSFQHIIDVLNLNSDGQIGDQLVRLLQGNKFGINAQGIFGLIQQLSPEDWQKMENFNKLVELINFLKIFENNPPPPNTTLDFLSNLFDLSLGDAFDLMDNRAGGIQTTEINQQVLDNTKQEDNSGDQHDESGGGSLIGLCPPSC